MSTWERHTSLPNPKFEFLDGGHIKLLENFAWGLERVPAGFICDGSSVPRVLHSYVRPFGDGLRAALFHDQDYRAQQVTRAVADARFHHRLKLIGMRKSKAWVVWAGVRAGGWVTWKKHKAVLAAKRHHASS